MNKLVICWFRTKTKDKIRPLNHHGQDFYSFFISFIAHLHSCVIMSPPLSCWTINNSKTRPSIGYCTYSIIHKGTTSLGRLWKSCSPIDARHWLISVSETSSQILQVSPVLLLRKARDNVTSECVKIQLFTYFLWFNFYNQLTSRYPRQIT